MVISAETPSRPPDPVAGSAAAATTEATPARGETQDSLLHNLSFPIFKTWGSHRVLRCMSVNGKREIVAGTGRRSEASESPTRAQESDCGGDPGIEEVREKLLVHLREAADRMRLVVPLPTKGRGGDAEPPPAPAPAPASEVSMDSEANSSKAPAERPWNLRTRRRAARVPMGIERHLSGPPPVAAETRTVRLRSEAPERRERPKFSISLTREEIEEDIYAVTGCRARRRPIKRARVVQKQLDSLFPGLWLSEITVDSYRVPD
ncbi:hypothetical protein C4D60_Mb03t01250 [Musa balbisiana]|uniref:DUF1639 family protein n=1 Tax=Musa balbisiana TaxID=52838 RepID=A0A4S8J959_MUSBA|nr:hypothetical protein C4D60_Mb03t01250 [Musa balbisiana]